MFRRPIVALLMGHPFELLIAFWGVIAGLPLALGVITPSVTMAQLDPTLLSMFGFMLAFGGLAAFIGLYTFFVTSSYVHQIIAMRVEQTGWVVLGSAVLTHAILLIYLRAPGTTVGLITFFAISLACLGRYLSLRQVIRSYGRSLKGK